MSMSRVGLYILPPHNIQYFVFSNRGLVMSSSVICCPVVLQVTVCYRTLDTIDVRFSSLNIRGEYKPEHFGKEQNE